MKAATAVIAVSAVILAGCASSPSAQPSTPAPVSSSFFNDNASGPPIPSTSPTSSSTPTKASAPVGHSVGEAVKLDVSGQNGANVTIVSASYVPAIGTGAYARTAKKGGFLVLDVVWETTSGVTNSNPYNFSLRDSAGHGGDTTPGTGDDLDSNPIPVGDKAAGKLAVDVGPGPWRLTVTFEGKPTYWNIPAS